MTNQQMLDNVKDNLGNRASGRIGSRDVDTVVLDALNVAVPHCVQEAQPDYYNRTATIAIVQGTREYELPVVDTDADTIRIKDIYTHRCFRAGNTEVILHHVNYAEFVRRVPDYALAVEGTPSLFSLWGKTNKLHLDYVPWEALTLSLFVEVFPNLIETSDLATALPINEQWNLAVEAKATSYCYLKLQQREMYAIWEDTYLKQKPSIQRQENRKHGHNQGGQKVGRHISDPVNNPAVRDWNS